MKNALKFCTLILLFVAVSCSNEPIIDLQEESLELINNKASHSTVEIFNPVYGTTPGTSTLHRNAHGITVNYKTSGLIPGNAYTLWWVIWNNPGNCEVPYACNEPDFANPVEVGVEVLYAAGHVVGANGKGNFSARLNAGDNSGSINDLFGLPAAGGLLQGNTMEAEVHAVLRNHGPAVPGLVNEQINSYLGGCEIFLPLFAEDADDIGECNDIEFAIHPPAN
ncbi:MAG: hypothetical protein KJO77_05690 [Bacteroidia bacterium]|nr:hypothetical protein [Bacteroidia bacterium]